MTRQDAGRTAWLSVVFYILGGLWLFAGFAVLVTLPIATLVALWVGGHAALVYFGVM